MPKPTVKTPENETIILAAIGYGASLTMAAECAGIDPSTLYQWKRESPEFRASIARAKAERAQRCLAKITESDDWRAHAWYLERQYPEDFALVQRIEQVLKRYGLISPGIVSQIEEAGMAERLQGMSVTAIVQAMTNEQLLGVLAVAEASAGSEEEELNLNKEGG